MFIKNLSKKEKIGLSIAAFFIFLVVLDRAVFLPVRGRIDRLQKEIEIHEREMRQHLFYLDRKENVEGEHTRYVQDIVEKRSEEEEMAGILAEVETIARNAGLSVLDIRSFSPRQESFLKKYAVDMAAESDTKTLINFLHCLSSSQQLLRAEKLTVSPRDAEGTALKISVVITKVVIPGQHNEGPGLR
ncbi:MAG: GspMb/PilO family protein [Candidatus Omnitrophota bacterium]